MAERVERSGGDGGGAAGQGARPRSARRVRGMTLALERSDA